MNIQFIELYFLSYMNDLQCDSGTLYFCISKYRGSTQYGHSPGSSCLTVAVNFSFSSWLFAMLTIFSIWTLSEMSSPSKFRIWKRISLYSWLRFSDLSLFCSIVLISFVYRTELRPWGVSRMALSTQLPWLWRIRAKQVISPWYPRSLWDLRFETYEPQNFKAPRFRIFCSALQRGVWSCLRLFW